MLFMENDPSSSLVLSFLENELQRRLAVHGAEQPLNLQKFLRITPSKLQQAANAPPINTRLVLKELRDICNSSLLDQLCQMRWLKWLSAAGALDEFLGTANDPLFHMPVVDNQLPLAGEDRIRMNPLAPILWSQAADSILCSTNGHGFELPKDRVSIR